MIGAPYRLEVVLSWLGLFCYPTYDRGSISVGSGSVMAWSLICYPTYDRGSISVGSGSVMAWSLICYPTYDRGSYLCSVGSVGSGSVMAWSLSVIQPMIIGWKWFCHGLVFDLLSNL